MPASVIDPAAMTFDELIAREWLLTNGAGGYASSTTIGLNTRKYHGLLVAAMAPPVRRMVILSRVEETVTLGGRSWQLASVEYPGVIHPAGHALLRAFDPLPYPRWAYQGEGWTIEKTLQFSPGGTHELMITWTLLGGEKPVQIEVKPLFALRGIHDLMYQWSGRLEASATDTPSLVRIAATARTPEACFAHDGEFDARAYWYLSTIYRRERERGYAGLEDLWMPGAITYQLSPGRAVHLAVSVDRIDLERSLAELGRQEQQRGRQSGPAPADTDAGITRALAAAAEKFCVWSPPAERRPWTSIIPQYPWTAMSVRDMLISLPGLLLVHGKQSAARTLLVKLSEQIRDGLVPSEIDEKGGEPAYNACDTSLWFIHAAWSYAQATVDDETTRRLLPAIRHIIEKYQTGTSLGIGVNGDQLLRARSPGLGCTWMNAKVGDWVITPRHGRPVEVNALWYNALCATAALLERVGESSHAAPYQSAAARHQAAFNQRFWNSASNCCIDVAYENGDDPAIRPNQLLAVSLPFAVLSDTHWRPLLNTVREQLRTPFGLRTLAPSDPNYQGRYGGDVVARDRAYHQGAAYPWLLGPYATALGRTFGRTDATRQEVRKLLAGCIDHLTTAGLGQLPELFDGDPPHRPGGVVADARSIGEIARVWHEEIVGTDASRLPNSSRKPQLA